MCVDERHGDELFCRFLVSLTVLIALQDIYQKRKHKKADLKVSTFHSGPGLDCTALCEAKKKSIHSLMLFPLHAQQSQREDERGKNKYRL